MISYRFLYFLTIFYGFPGYKLNSEISNLNFLLLLVVFVEVAPGRNRGIPGASKSRTTLPPYYTCHEGDVRWANISLGFAKYFIGFAKYSPTNPGQQPTTCVTREAERWGGSL